MSRPACFFSSIDKGKEPPCVRGIFRIGGKGAGEHLFLIMHAQKLKRKIAEYHEQRPRLLETQHGADRGNQSGEIKRMANPAVWPLDHETARFRQEAKRAPKPGKDNEFSDRA